MAWISSLLKKQEGQTEEEPALRTEAVERSPVPPMIDAPQMAVLAPDIGGISSFRLKLFDDAATAELFVENMDPAARRATHAFWALHDEPDIAPDAHKEALVMIRANPTGSVVYVVSFVDLKSAWSFARFETKRGLDPSHLLIYWASFAAVREELDTVTIVPSSPPATLASGAPWIERDTTRPLDRPVATPPAAAEPIGRPAESEASNRAAAEAKRRVAEAKDAAAQAEKLAELAKQAEAEAAERSEAAKIAEAERAAREEREKAILAAAEKAEQERLLAAAEAIRDAEAERIAMKEESARQAELARLEAEAAAARKAEAERIAAEAQAAREIEEARAEAEAEAKIRADEDRLEFADGAQPTAQLEPTISGEAGVMTPPEPVTSYPGDEEETADDSDAENAALPPSGVVFTHAPAETVKEPAKRQSRRKKGKSKEFTADPAAELPEQPTLDDFDIAYEVERLLKNRQWEKRDEPFGGFSSPPGRF